MPQEKGPNFVKIGIGVFLVFAIVATCLTTIPASKATTPKVEQAPVVEKPDTPENQKPEDAFYAAKLSIEKRLKAPTSAIWPDWETAKIGFKEKTQTWIVSSYVDSQNDYGAMIRTYYVAEIAYYPGKGWEMIDFESMKN